MKNSCSRAEQAMRINRKKMMESQLLIALTCLTIFAIGMEIVTATRSAETYDSKQKNERDNER